eukprot:jgi/Phyca11/96981/e_gw1.1.1469.1
MDIGRSISASVLEYPFSDDEIENRFWNFGGFFKLGHKTRGFTSRETKRMMVFCSTTYDTGMVREKLSERLFSITRSKLDKVYALLKGLPPAASLRE